MHSRAPLSQDPKCIKGGFATIARATLCTPNLRRLAQPPARIGFVSPRRWRTPPSFSKSRSARKLDQPRHSRRSPICRRCWTPKRISGSCKEHPVADAGASSGHRPINPPSPMRFSTEQHDRFSVRDLCRQSTVVTRELLFRHARVLHHRHVLHSLTRVGREHHAYQSYRDNDPRKGGKARPCTIAHLTGLRVVGAFVAQV